MAPDHAQETPETGASKVAEATYELEDLLQDLAGLLPEPVGDPTVGTTAHRKHVAGSPAPWHQEAASVLFTVHEGVRRLEASLRRDVAGGLGRRRGGSDLNTFQALRAIRNLAHGVDEARARKAARIMSVWISHARTIRDIDQAARWDPLQAVKTTDPAVRLSPPCPYCQTYSLRVARVSGAIRCFNPACRDELGNSPSGHLSEAPYSGYPMITWADGRQIYYQEAS